MTCQKTTYTGDKLNYFTVLGAVGLASIVSFTTPTVKCDCLQTPNYTQVDWNTVDSFTIQALSLVEKSLAEDWDQEYDNHWDNF